MGRKDMTRRTGRAKRDETRRRARRRPPIPIVLLMMFMSIFPALPRAYGETPASPAAPSEKKAPAGSEASSTQTAASPAATETAGVEELIQVLLENGALKQEQVEAMMQQKGTAGFSAVAALTEMLKANGVITPAQADRVAKKAASPSRQKIALHYEPSQEELEAMAQSVTDRIDSDFKEQVKEEVKQEVLQETQKQISAAAAPEWVKRIRFSGDVRLRYEGDFFNKNNALFLNPSSPTQLLNSQTERDRFLVLARLGATANFTDNVEAGLRLTTGSASSPVMINQTMGTYFDKYSVTLDLAYLKLTPLPGLTLIGGRIPNPWFFTDLVWYRNLTFEGFSGMYQPKLSGSLQPFFTLGAFPLQEVELSTQDKYLFAGQAGLDIKLRKDLSGRIAGAFYGYVNTRASRTAPLIRTNTITPPPSSSRKGTRFSTSSPPPSLRPFTPWPQITGSLTSTAPSTSAFGTPSTSCSWAIMSSTSASINNPWSDLPAMPTCRPKPRDTWRV